MSDTGKKIEEFFSLNPSRTEVFTTTDGFLFIKKADATDHAKTLNPDSPVVETIENRGQLTEDKKDKVGKLSPAELKALKEKATQGYTELFGTAPDSKLSGAKIQELIDAKKAELAKASNNENN